MGLQGYGEVGTFMEVTMHVFSDLAYPLPVEQGVSGVQVGVVLLRAVGTVGAELRSPSPGLLLGPVTV